MKRALLGLVVCVAMVVLAGPAWATTILSFTPNPADFGELAHDYYYAWKINNISIPANEVIVKAELSFEDINDWKVENGDILYIHLLNSIYTGTKLPMVAGGDVYRWVDSQNPVDAFLGRGILLTTYTDDDTGLNPSEDWSYVFKNWQLNSLKNYINTGHNIAFGLDPDCHYYNKGLTFTITTDVMTPEPASMVLLGIGLSGVLLRRRKSA